MRAAAEAAAGTAARAQPPRIATDRATLKRRLPVPIVSFLRGRFHVINREYTVT